MLLLPLSHTWDGQTWLNTFAQLAGPGSFLEALQRPYEVVREQTLLTAAAGHHTDFYEGWAYPPLMLYVYYPLAKLFTALGGDAQAIYPVQPTFYVSTLPLPLEGLIRLPNLIADMACLFVLHKLGVSDRGLRWYAFNPLVLLVGLWTFDSAMLLWLLLAIVFAEQSRWDLAGVALGLGAATKFVPVVALPAFGLALLAADSSAQTRLMALGRLLGSFVLTAALLVAPVWRGLADVLLFHSSRFSSGLTIQQFWRTWAAELPNTDWQPRWQLYASTLTGNLLLPLALLVACALIAWRPLDIRSSTLIMVLAFLVGSKLVNEPYALTPVALMTALFAVRPNVALLGCRTLLWTVALAYAAIQVPIWSMFFSFARQVRPDWQAPILIWANAYRDFLSDPLAALPFAVLATIFSVTAAVTMWIVWQQAEPTNEARQLRLLAGPQPVPA